MNTIGGGRTLYVPRMIAGAVCALAVLLLGAGCVPLDDRRKDYPAFGGTGLTPASADRVGAPNRLTAPTQAAEPDAVGGSGLQTAELYRGTGQLVGRASPSLPVAVSGNGVTLNFVDAEISDVVAAILGETLGMNYEIDPRVQGKVTVRTAKPLPRDTVIPTLEEILATRGAVLVRSDTINRVLPADAAAATIGSESFRSGPDRFDQGFGLYFFPLEYTFAQSLRTVLEPFVPPGRVLRADPERNLLIFTGTSVESRDMESLIAAFDIDRMAGMSFGLYPVSFCRSAVADQRTAGGVRGWRRRPGRGRRLIPAGGAAECCPGRLISAEIISTISRRGSRAWTAARRVSGVGSMSIGSRTVAPSIWPRRWGQFWRMQAWRRNRTATGWPRGWSRSSFRALRRRPALPMLRGPPTRETQVYRSEAQASRSPGDGSAGIPFSGSGADMRIVADPRNNALLVWSTPAEYRMILTTIRELDIIPLQTLIEATIVEVTLRDNLEYGLQWFFRAGDSSFTFSDTATGAIAPSFPGFSYVLSATDVQVVLDALTEITDIKVISSPQLLVLDNEAARLQVGDEVPIATQSSQSIDDPAAPLVSTIEYRDTGVILEVTPRVNAGGLVVLDIVQEVSTVSETTSSTLNSPTISTRRIESTVAVQGGETVALGGLIEDTRTDIEIGIPLLADIPILGNLFKTTTDRIERTELLVLLTPRVVRDLQDARDVTQELRERLTGLDVFTGGESEG